MTRVNASDRGSLERAYPAAAFASDAAQNDKTPNELMHGVRIGSAPDAEGWFELERAVRHAGEPASGNFLAPTRRSEELVDRGRYSAPAQVDAPDPARGYRRFLEDVVEAAKRFGYRPEESPGRGDPRLKGLRQ
jgi:hypothetical protein